MDPSNHMDRARAALRQAAAARVQAQRRYTAAVREVEDAALAVLRYQFGDDYITDGGDRPAAEFEHDGCLICVWYNAAEERRWSAHVHGYLAESHRGHGTTPHMAIQRAIERFADPAVKAALTATVPAGRGWNR